MISRTNVLLSVLLLIVVVVTAFARVDYSRPNVEVLPDMKYTPAWSAFKANPNFPNGRTMQDPVHGTIARGEMPLHFAAAKEDAVLAGEQLINPYDRDDVTEATREELRGSVQRGGPIYRAFCVCCHGPNGAGDGPVPKRGFPPPPSLLTGKSLQMKDGQLFHVLTYGQGSMAPFAAQLSHQQRWDVINFIRDIQNKAKPSDHTGAPTQ